MLKGVLALCLVLVLAVACGSSGSGSTVNSVAPAAPAVPAAAPAKGGAAGSKPADAPGVAPQALPLDRMIIRQGSLSITVKDPVAGVQAITAIVEGVNGYVASTNYQNVGKQQTTSMSVRIPSQDYATVLQNIRGLALKVNQETTTSQDVTEQFSDLNAQLRNLQATETQYLVLMNRAQTVDEIIKVQTQLTEVRGKIEQIQGQINFIQRKSDFSQLEITLIPEAQQVEVDQSRFVNALTNGWEASLTALSGILYVIVLFWWLIPAALIGFGIAWIFNRRQPARSAPTPKPPEAGSPPNVAPTP